MMAEQGFLEAAAQFPLRAAGRDRWTSRAAFWTAVRFGGDGLQVHAWPQARERWTELWAIATREHLAPIPGAPEVGASPSTVAAEQNLARMRAIVQRGKHVHR
ncbi:hypothetical protein [Cupriavidus malaysiensis]|uniref:Uncharacterized protein n=1 Tax=Cupriavidus malaysiensis TaxID=367825 RepID=A0ABM6F3J4_9BURK|nr:hypothetical protein [Cupriavidus malaysiensis]AOZ05951.1 hypothetical protein BKK80_09015 [Cupriavidus malaysiensis]